MKTILSIIIGLFMTVSTWAEATRPLATLQTPIDTIITILKNPQYQDPTLKEEQYNQIRSIIEEVFDLTIISRRATGRYWNKFSFEEKKAFTEAFSQLLINSYIQKIQGKFKDERVAYLGEQDLSKNRVLVKTKIIRENIDIPVDYRMQMINNSWKVYDVSVEGVSMVKNYRTQFSQLLIKESPLQLIQRIETKIEKQKIAMEK